MRLYSGFAKLFEQKPFSTGLFGNVRAGVGAMALALALSAAGSGALAETPAPAPLGRSPTAPAAPAAPTAAGFWQSNYDPGKPSGWFYFVEHNGVYEGRLVKGFKKNARGSGQ